MEYSANLDVIDVVSAARKGVPKSYFCIYGCIRNDSKNRFPDGADIYTSPVCELDTENDLVITYYSSYKVTKQDMDKIQKLVAKDGFKFYTGPKRK